MRTFRGTSKATATWTEADEILERTNEERREVVCAPSPVSMMKQSSSRLMSGVCVQQELFLTNNHAASL